MIRYIAFTQGEDPKELCNVIDLKGNPLKTVMYSKNNGRWYAYLINPSTMRYNWIGIPMHEVPDEYRAYVLLTT